MKTLILEDEVPAQHQLKRLLSKHFPDYSVEACLPSVTAAVAWFKKNSADIIFMDVELSDGVCFELFKMVHITSHVIITTAYEHYALNAFKENCVDYLLKPIDEELFVQAVARCKARKPLPPDMARLEQLLHPHKTYKQRFTVKLGTQIIVVPMVEVAYFYSQDKLTFLVTHEAKHYPADMSLEAIEERLDPALFFKLSRGCLAGISSIRSISKYFNSRLRVTLQPELNTPILMPRARVPLFLSWLEGTVR